jgi:hypothetical protein
MSNGYEKRKHDTEDHEVELRHHLDILKNFMLTACQLMQGTRISLAVPADVLDNLVKASSGNGDTDRKGGRTKVSCLSHQKKSCGPRIHVLAAET